MYHDLHKVKKIKKSTYKTKIITSLFFKSLKTQTKNQLADKGPEFDHRMQQSLLLPLHQSKKKKHTQGGGIWIICSQYRYRGWGALEEKGQGLCP